MVDITKEEFWNNNEEISKIDKKDSRIKQFIINHKVITVLLITLSSLIVMNTILIYNFLKILTEI